MLSFLALLSGLAAASPSANACAFTASRAEISAVWQDQAATRVSAHVVAHAKEVARPAQPLTMVLAEPMLAAPRVATVRLRVDRALN
jgi:hypothetical protein